MGQDRSRQSAPHLTHAACVSSTVEGGGRRCDRHCFLDQRRSHLHLTQCDCLQRDKSRPGRDGSAAGTRTRPPFNPHQRSLSGRDRYRNISLDAYQAPRGCGGPLVWPEGSVPLTKSEPGKAADAADAIHFLLSASERHITRLAAIHRRRSGTSTVKTGTAVLSVRPQSSCVGRIVSTEILPSIKPRSRSVRPWSISVTE